MNRFWKTLVVLPALLVLAATSSLFADHRLEYGGWTEGQTQTRNIAAGTVVDPGSQLLFIVDTGVNLLRPSQFTKTDLDNKTVGPGVNEIKSLTDGAVTGKGATVLTNFLAITNSHPTQAVTVHIRYYNDQCVDVLDFLVLLTCNDSFIFNPFDFLIPGVSIPLNTNERIFGPTTQPELFPTIKGNEFRSGRFLLTVNASGTSTNAGDEAELLFPHELVARSTATGTPITSGKGTGCQNITEPTVGDSPGGATGTNLHVFNASAIAFDYLIGHHTTAVPKGFIKGAASDQDKFLAYGVNAWTRPSVDVASGTQLTSAFDGHDDGDGPSPHESSAGLPRILTGGEQVRTSSRISGVFINTNALYLRNEVHGGDSFRVDANRLESHYGAIGWTAIHGGTENINQKMDLLSIVDDYNGSNNPEVLNDRSYNVGPAETVYVLQIYDNSENIFDIPPGQRLNISPLPEAVTGVFLRVFVDCLETWVSERVTGTAVDDLSLDDLNKISANILTGGGANTAFKGLNAPTNDLVDASKGWIRLVRDNTTRTGTVVGRPNAPTTRRGTTSMDAAGVDLNSLRQPSFVTIGQVVVRFEGFGASWWLAGVPSDARVSELSDPTPP